MPVAVIAAGSPAGVVVGKVDVLPAAVNFQLKKF